MRKTLILLIAFYLTISNVNAQQQKPLKPLLPKIGIDGLLEFGKKKEKTFEEKMQDIKKAAENKSVTRKITEPPKEQVQDSLDKISDKSEKKKSSWFGKKTQQKAEKVESQAVNKATEEKPSQVATEIKQDTNVTVKQPVGTEQNTVEQTTAKTQTASISTTPEKITTKKSLTFEDLDAKRIADEIQGDIEFEKENVLADLRILWQAAVEKSETIRFAILKLSNPEGDQEKKNVVKKILTPLTSVAPLIGMGSGDPVAGGSAILGGGLLSSLLADDSQINQQLSKVTDVDLVIMAQEIDNLQQKLVVQYYTYVSSVERLKLMDQIVENRYKYYMTAHNAPNEVLAVADVFYRESLDMQYKARQELLTSRAALEQLVGNDAIVQVDSNIKSRTQ